MDYLIWSYAAVLTCVNWIPVSIFTNYKYFYSVNIYAFFITCVCCLFYLLCIMLFGTYFLSSNNFCLVTLRINLSFAIICVRKYCRANPGCEFEGCVPLKAAEQLISTLLCPLKLYNFIDIYVNTSTVWDMYDNCFVM